MNSDLTLEEKKLVFKFRTRMLNFGENFRGGQTSTICPLCNSHNDSQFLALSCPKIVDEIESEDHVIDSEFQKNIQNDTVKKPTIETLKLIMKIREKYY